MAQTRDRPPLSAWLEAARPRTLALAVAGVGLGILLGAARANVHWATALLTVSTAILLQILSNLANDYGDSLHGADSTGRVGPRRAVQSGLIGRAQMQRAMGLTALLAMVSGLSLLWFAFGAEALLLLILFLLIGAAAVWAAFAYTASARPYGYAGLGDLAVFLFFGWVAVGGAYFLQVRELPPAIFLPATSVGLFAVAVLNVNNIRDIESDRRAGKRSIPVRVGLARARLYHGALLLGGFVAALAYVLVTYRSPWQLLFLVTVPLLLVNGRVVSHARAPGELDPMLKQMSLTTLVFVVTFGVGHVLA